MSIKLLIVDDHNPFRRMLRATLSDLSEFEVVDEASNGLEAVEKARKLKPDVVIMDLIMPELDGAEATARLKDSVPDVKVLVLTLFDETDRIYTAIKAGAMGYSLKTDDFDGIVAAIREVAAGNVLITPVIATRILRDAKPAKIPPAVVAVELTAREKSVIQLISQGVAVPEIARRLSVEEGEIRDQMRQVFEKFQAG